MKRKILLLMLCLAVLALWGCNGFEKSEDEAEGEKGKLYIGIDDRYEPFTYVDENGNYVGLDIDLAKEACKRMGLEPVFVAIKWDNKNTYLAEGTIDCVWSCYSMNGLEDEYDWVGPYMYSRQMVVVRSDSTIEKLEDLTGKSVAVMSSTKPETIFLNSTGIPQVKNVYCMDNMDLTFSALEYGYVDATAGHETVMKQYIETTSGQYRLLEESLLSSDVGVAFAKDKNTATAEQLRSTLDEMKTDGTLGNILSQYGVEMESDGGNTQ